MDNLPANSDEKVITGSWGGEHIGFEAKDTGAEVDFDCAHGAINQRITLDKNGKFDVAGTYVLEHAGPVRADETANSRTADYTGFVKDKTMTLTVTLTGSKELVGTFYLIRDARAKVMKCR